MNVRSDIHDDDDGQEDTIPDLSQRQAQDQIELELFPPDEPPQQPSPASHRLILKLPMVPPTRSRTRASSGHQPSGSEYSGGASHRSASSHSPQGNTRRRTNNRVVHDDDDEEDYTQAEPVFTEYTSSRGRTVKLKHPQYNEDSDEEDEAPIRQAGSRRAPTRVSARTTRSTSIHDDFLVPDEDDFGLDDDGSHNYRSTRSRTRKATAPPNDTTHPPPPSSAELRSIRAARRTARVTKEEEDYVDGAHDADDDAEGSMVDDEDLDDPVPSTPEEHKRRPETPEPRGYGLRKRNTKVDYRLPPPLAAEEVAAGALGDPNAAMNKAKNRAKAIRSVVPWGFARPGGGAGAGFGRPPPRADDSDSDLPTQTPRKQFGAAAGNAAGGLFPAGASGTGFLPSDLAAAAGTPSNLGKIGTDSALADADPLGVNKNVTFEEVGGLDDHITSLKEMVTLPLLYPEVFQRFNLTPPRGVLFHGPPGTGKTLLARALAASSRSGGKGISFYMRKGADCLSKWVGEAERQLRLLFEEAKACQPSIIFFDEIDGLAPVRSSKQDQIHASIVSTLLALMDGMDGRGQVIVIGATNRPDAIDPALRRPGRFDREFYFPLPSLSARQKILNIITKGWEGLDAEGDELRLTLAKATKGYGGADLRALCTEAALNAVQRRYPQIYKSNDRLLLKPESIKIQARDFMISVKNMIPSSQRSAASAAAPLPSQLVPLLDESLKKVTAALDRVLPKGNKRRVLEEAEFEDVDGDVDGGLERELMLQSMETLRVHRPRVVLYGRPGMGQSYIGSAALHHLEGFHVQSMDLGTLMGDSTRTVESAIVQLFVEAKRHKPSIIYIPSMIGWCAAVSEAARTTVRAMLDSLSPTDPLLLVGVVDGELSALPRDVRAWFGHNRENRIALQAPNRERRDVFFKELIGHVRRPPTQFPDGVARKKRILEVLPIAPPLPPRMPTAAEIAAQEEGDARLKAMLTHRLGPVLQDLKKKYKRFTKAVRAEYDLEDDHGDPWSFIDASQERREEPQPPKNDKPQTPPPPPAAPVPAPVPVLPISEFAAAPAVVPNGVMPDADGDASMNGILTAHPPPPIHSPPFRKFYEIDLEKMHAKLYYEGYLTPGEFIEDISRIVANAEVEPIDNERLFKAQAMFTSANLTILSWEPQFALECERMAQREMERLKEKRKHAKAKGKSNVNGAAAEGAPVNGTAGTYAPGTRRSARNNGEEPEISLTDPLQLERRLKRQRGDGAGDSQGSDLGAGARSPKRARASASEDEGVVAAVLDPGSGLGPGPVPGERLPSGETDMTIYSQGFQAATAPLDGLHHHHHHQPQMPQQQHPYQYPPQPYMDASAHLHPRSVRFAPDLGYANPYPDPHVNMDLGMGNPMGMPMSNGLGPQDGMQLPPHPDGLPHHHQQDGMQPHHHQQDGMQQHQHPQDGMPHQQYHQDGMQPVHGLPQDPMGYPQHGQPFVPHGYLSPVPTTPNPMSLDYQLNHPNAGGVSSSSSQASALPPLPAAFAATSSMYGLLEDGSAPAPQSSMMPQAPTSAPDPDDPFGGGGAPQMALPSFSIPQEGQDSMEIGAAGSADGNDMSMDQPTIRPRTPSPTPPPPPDFHVDDDLVAKLESELVDRTEAMNVEQLEQLRASLLSSVWKRRSDWDRDELVREMLEMVNEFVLEINEDDGFGSP